MTRRPTHPGAVLREDVFPALGLKIKPTAELLGISRQMLHRIPAEKAPITPETAVRIGKLCGNGPALWLSMQVKCDLWEAERRLADTVKDIPTLRAVARTPRPRPETMTNDDKRRLFFPKNGHVFFCFNALRRIDPALTRPRTGPCGAPPGPNGARKRSGGERRVHHRGTETQRKKECAARGHPSSRFEGFAHCPKRPPCLCGSKPTAAAFATNPRGKSS